MATRAKKSSAITNKKNTQEESLVKGVKAVVSAASKQDYYEMIGMAAGLFAVGVFWCLSSSSSKKKKSCSDEFDD